MIKNIAIIMLALLGQLNIVSFEEGNAGFLKQFIEQEPVGEKFDSREINWNHYANNRDWKKSFQPLPSRVKGAADFEIEAKSALVLDIRTGASLYSKNSDEKMPIASLTKMMTALLVIENINLDDTVIISENALGADGKKDGLEANEKIKAEDLLKIMLIRSNNTAAVSFAEHTSGSVEKFVKLMNEKAELLGLKNTNFSNPTGLDSEENYSTAYDIAQLFDYAVDKPLIWEILRIQNLSLTSLDGKIEHDLKNTNLLLGRLDNIVGGKTGLTDKAGQCLALVVGDPVDNHQIISVVLNAEDRFLETEKLIRWVWKSYEW